MAFLEIGGDRHPVPAGEMVIGSAASSTIALPTAGVAPRHAIIQGQPDGQVVIRKAADDLDVRINGVRLGPQPTPLLHGDKVEIAGHELLFVDERRSGSTQYVQAFESSAMAQAAKPTTRRPAAATGGRLVSLTDGREYALTGTSLLIGRDAACDVVITSRNVSRRHAEIIATPKGYVLVDSSTNGTIVNGQRVEGQQVLARGDVIVCGEHEFRFYADVATGAPPPAAAPVPPPAAAPGRKASEPPARKPAAAGPPPGAEHRLSNTLHGVPAVARPAPPAEPAPPAVPRAPTPAKRPGAKPILANLVVRGGPLKGRRFPLKVPVVNVGRADYNDVVIPDASVSTTHAKLQRREGIWILVDLESTNGTAVDGERVSGEVPLAPGAVIRVGDVEMMFEPKDDAVGAQQGGATRVIDAAQFEAAPAPPPTRPAPPPAPPAAPPPPPAPPARPKRRTAPRRPRTVARRPRSGGRGKRIVVLLLLAAVAAAVLLLGG